MEKPLSQVPTHNVMLEDFGWETPVETVPVPSEGKVYPTNSALFGKSTLQIKAMTAHEEDILTSRALLQQGTVINYLIRSCLIDKSVDPQSMLLGDRNALMVSVRITGYGTLYRAAVDCPSCKSESSQDFDLSALTIKRLDLEPVRSGENVFTFTLPVTKKEIHFKFLTGVDESEGNTIAERTKKLMPDIPIDRHVTSRLEQSIVSVDGITDKNKINKFIKCMPAQDSRKLRWYINEHEPGIDMTCPMSCPHCGKDSDVPLPLGINFFWPTE